MNKWISFLLFIMLNMMCLMMLSCSSPSTSSVLYAVEIYEEGDIINWDGQTFRYVILNDSVAVDESGAPMLWKVDYDTVKLLNEVHATIRLLPEIARTGNHDLSNIVKKDYIYKCTKARLFEANPFMKTSRYTIHRAGNCDSILSNMDSLLKGDFEYRAACNLYDFRHSNDSIGIFSSSDKYRKYRMVNGLDNPNYSLKKVGTKYLFRYHTYVPVVSANGDTVGPLWVEGYLPSGFRRVTEASPNDLFFEYKDDAIIWVHLDSSGLIHNINRPVEMSEEVAEEIVLSTFPKVQLYNGLSEIRSRLLVRDKGKNINLHTDRCTILARGISNKDILMLSSLLKSSFIEKNQLTMFEFFLMTLNDIDTFSKYNPDMFNKFKNIFINITDLNKLIIRFMLPSE